MGLIYGEWRFPGATPPAPAAIARALGEATGLDVRLETQGADAAVVIVVPLLGQRLFKWRIDGDLLAVHGFVPAHPYLWENLDAVLRGLGGVPGPEEHAWRPDARHAGLRRPWQALGAAPRLLLRLPTIGAWRPQDGLLTGGSDTKG
jgi:hypothetical protein